MSSLQPWAEETLKYIGVSLGTLMAAWGVRRRISQESLTVQKNDGEAVWMADIRKERDECMRREREIYSLHVKDAAEMARLNLRIALMLERIERFEREAARIKRLLIDARPEFEPFLRSAFGGFDEAPTADDTRNSA